MTEEVRIMMVMAGWVHMSASECIGAEGTQEGGKTGGEWSKIDVHRDTREAKITSVTSNRIKDVRRKHSRTR